MSRRIEIVCVTTICIAIILFASGASMYDKSDQSTSESNTHNEFIGYVIILVGLGFFIISNILCCVLIVRQHQPKRQLATLNDIQVNYETFN